MPLYVFSGWENCLQTQTWNQRLAWINYVMGTWDSLLQLWLEKCTANYKQPCRTKDASSSCHPQLKMSNPVTQQRGFHPEPQCTLPDMQSNINIKPPPCFVKPRVIVECFPPLKSVHWHSTELGRVPIFALETACQLICYWPGLTDDCGMTPRTTALHGVFDN